MLGISALGSRLKRLGDRLIEDCARIYSQGGVPFEPRWFPLVRVLSDRGPVTITEAARHLGVTHAAISQIAGAMEKQKLLERKPDRNDRRQSYLGLTPSGQSLVAELSEYWTDLRSAAQLLTAGFEKDLLSSLEQLEKSYAQKDLIQAFGEARVTRLAGQVEFVPYSKLEENKSAFRDLNLEFLTEYRFKLEAFDRRVFQNPEKEIIKRGGEIYFLTMKKQAIGCFALIPVRGQPGVVELAKMAVSRKWRGWGLGQKILLFAEERARKLGADRVVLATSTKLVAARRLYERFNYRVVPEPAGVHYERVDLYMEKLL